MVIELSESVRRQVLEKFRALKFPVTVYLFTSRNHCLHCNEAEEIVNLVASLSNLVRVSKCECDVGSAKAREFNIDKHPAIVIHGSEKYNIRYFGTPSGYEFATLIEAIVAASTGEPLLPPGVLDLVKKVNKKAHVKVFVTTTCPYCPMMATIAYRFAIANSNIISDVIEAAEFPDLAMKHQVLAVPKTTINDVVSFEGAVPERVFAERLLKAVGGG